MKTNVTRRGNRWTFCLEARVSLQYVLEDPEEEAHVVKRKMREIAQAAFDEALAKGECRRNGDVSSLLVWDKNDQYTAGHPWAEPDPRDDFPGYCCWPGCDELSATNGTPGSCLKHAKEICSECGWLRLPGSGCKCPKKPLPFAWWVALGCGSGSTLREAERCYRVRSKLYGPDGREPNPDMFRALQSAIEEARRVCK
jgi:hypothetical protein